MDLSSPIIYNGFTAAGLTNLSGGRGSVGTVIESVNLSNISADAFLEKRALQDGMDASDVYLGARTVEIVAGVYDSSEGAAWDRLQDFLAAFSPRLAYNADTANLGFLPLKFYQPTGDISTWPTSSFPSGIPLQVYLRPLAPPRYQVRRRLTGGVAEKGLSFEVAVSLVARDPRKYLQTAQTLNVNGSGFTATHRGDYPVFPIVTWTMTAAGGALNVSVAGGTVAINLTGVSSGSYTFDYAKRSLVNSSGTSFMGLISGSPVYNEIQPGGSAVAIFDNTGLANSRVVFTWSEAFA